MKSLFNKVDYDEMVDRIKAIKPDNQRQWGQMNADQMLCHVTDPFRDVLGMRQVKPSVPKLLRPLFKRLLLSKKPFRKNLPTLIPYAQRPDGTGTKPTNFENDKQQLLDVLDRFYAVGADHDFEPHAGVGKMTGKENGLLMWKHLDHHLRQFSA